MTRYPIVFYISGHGLGHASRDVEVINVLRKQRPDLEVAIRTAAPRWLFDLTLDRSVAFEAVVCDTGIVQMDSLRLDEAETMRRAIAFHRGFDERVAREARWLETHDAQVVVADIPALGCAAAGRAGIPAMALGNFSWDWIYEAYAGPDDRGAALLLDSLRAAYRSVTTALRLPLWGGFDPFPEVIDIPFIARHATRDPDEVRRALEVPEGRPLVLTSFGGYGVQGIDLAALSDLKPFTIVLSDATRPAALRERRGDSLRVLDERKLYRSGFRYEDLVRAADVVVTKPGYGIISECVANQTALLYTSRGHFREYDVLVRDMPRYLRCAYISNDDLLSGRWSEYLERLLMLPPPIDRPATHGADIVASRILHLIDTRRSAPLH